MVADDATARLSSSAHRLPTISATQALKFGRNDKNNTISLGLASLDDRLAKLLNGDDFSTHPFGGLSRGQLTEIYGPPGVGKTTFCIQAAVSALCAGNGVVWVDGGTRLAPPRLSAILERYRHRDSLASSNESVTDICQRFVHFSAPTMAHLLALLFHPPSNFPPTGTSIIIIDSLSTIFENAFVRSGLDRFPAQKTESDKWLAGRRQAVIGELASKLSKLAALSEVAILVTNKVTTKIVTGANAILRPSIIGQEWETALNARICLFRDWLPSPLEGERQPTQTGSVRFAEVVEPGVVAGASTVICYTINKTGVHEISADASPVKANTSSVWKNKRPYSEITGSDESSSDIEYGWLEDDVEELAAEGLVDNRFL